MERFNNCIKHRVLNRRFPEATVLESYRLYEMGFHLQLSGQLLFGATVDVLSDPVSDTEDEDYSQTACVQTKGCISILEADQLEELKVLYGDTHDHRFIDNLNNGIVKYKSYMFRDHHNRLTKSGSEQSECTNSMHESSYVHLKTRHLTNTFGRVQFIFDHMVDNKTHTLASIHWYEDAVVDTTSGLLHEHENKCFNTVPSLRCSAFKTTDACYRWS